MQPMKIIGPSQADNNRRVDGIIQAVKYAVYIALIMILVLMGLYDV
ncbi:hypothetical protein [Aureimonas fodinaquatilis]|nr:hypothetical protein [Aureimonas fodinaquatilis]